MNRAIGSENDLVVRQVFFFNLFDFVYHDGRNLWHLGILANGANNDLQIVFPFLQRVQASVQFTQLSV